MPESSSQTKRDDNSFAERYPNIAFWVELGYDRNTCTCARAGDEGGMTWSGGHPSQIPDEWMQTMENGVGDCIDELGLR